MEDKEVRREKKRPCLGKWLKVKLWLEEKTMQREKEQSAEITVFLTLILWVLLSFFGVMLGTAIHHSINTYSAVALQSAVGAVGTKYSAPLWEDYHLLMMEGRENQKEWLEQQVTEYLGERSGRWNQRSEALIEAEEMAGFTDENGRFYLYEIEEYMKYHAADRLLDRGEREEVLEASEPTMELLEKKRETEQSVSELDELVLSLMQSVEGVTIRGGRVRAQKHFVKLLCPEKISREAVGIPLDTVWKALQSHYQLPDTITVEMVRKLCRDIKEAERILNQMERKQASLQTEVEALKKNYQEAKETIWEEAKKGMEESIGKMERYTGKASSLSVYDVSRMQQILEEDRQVLYRFLETPEDREILKEYRIDGLTFSYQGFTLVKKDNPCDALEKAVDQSLLRLLVETPEELSTAGFGKEERYFDGEAGGTGFWDQAKVLSLELLYLEDHLIRYQGEKAEEKVHAGSYELEYLITGKDNDRDALAGVAARILAARTAIDFVAVLSDASKCAEAYEAAVASVGFTGLAALIEATKMAILSGWAAAEAMVDTALLLEGKKIPLIKSGSAFLVTFSDLFHFGRSLIRQKCAGYQEKGWGNSGMMTDYKDYLMTFLAAGNSINRRNRTLHVIEKNMKQRYKEDFTFHGGLYGFTCKGKFTYQKGASAEVRTSYAY